VTGIEQPTPRVNGTADRFLRVLARTVLPAGGFAVRGRRYLRTGCGVPAVAPSIILSQIGEVRLGAGVIRSQSVLSPSGPGFSPPYKTSYRGLKLPMVSAAFGRFQLRREADLPQVAPPSGAFPPVIRPGGTARAG
jgi:hypothetical protein